MHSAKRKSGEGVLHLEVSIPMTGRQNRHPGKSNLPDADRQETPTLAMQSDRNRRRSKEKFARYLSPWYERAPRWIPLRQDLRQPVKCDSHQRAYERSETQNLEELLFQGPQRTKVQLYEYK